MIAAVVLAAGAATRYGSPKQRVFLPAVLERLAQTSIGEVVIVEGAHELDGIDLGETRVVRCPDWERGPGASLRAGLAALQADVGAAVVVLADGPLLAPGAVARVVGVWRSRPDDVVAASYGGNRGHPLVIGRAAWSAVPYFPPLRIAC